MRLSKLIFTFSLMAWLSIGIHSAAGQVVSDSVFSVTSVDFQLLDGQQPSANMALAGALIRLNEARTTYPTINGFGYTIAVLDTGIDYTHPALAGRYKGGYDYVNEDSNPDDDNGHGTHVAGIAVSNDATYAGIAPQAGYAALKVLNSSGYGSFTNIESGLQWVIANREQYNIVAVNMSLGTSDIYNTPQTRQLSDELSTLRNAGVFIAASSGNGWYSHSPNQGVAYPAADASVVAVGDVWSANFGGVQWSSGAIDYTTAADRVVSHCDRSTTMLDILAPGAIITSAAYNWEGSNPDFVQMGGTSMASPAVAGLAVLLRQAIEEYWNPELWPTGADWQDTILSIMRDHGVSVFDGDDENDNVTNLNAYFTRIDVRASLDYVVSLAVPEPSTWAMLLTAAVGVALFWLQRCR